MKKTILLVFALVAVVVAEDDDMTTRLAAKFECDIQTIEACMAEAQMNTDEMRTMIQKGKMMNNENLDEDAKQNLMKYNLFMACMLEKKEMMQDSKLIVEKIIESIEKDMSKFSTPISIDTIKECMTALNENEAMSREERAMGVMICLTSNGMYMMEDE